MLQLTIAISPEMWDNDREVFIKPKTQIVELEHSLVSISKWESKWHKPFLTKQEKSSEETLDYLRCMTITPNVDPEIWSHITNDHVEQVHAYINDTMTATTVKDIPGSKKSNEIVTAELIYHWMISANVPLDRETWHLNKLLTLIKVCAVKSQPPKKMSRKEQFAQQRAINAARRKKYNSRG